eukprot:305644-Alexandrium_andersonii.AAC.1
MKLVPEHSCASAELLDKARALEGRRAGGGSELHETAFVEFPGVSQSFTEFHGVSWSFMEFH